ncbi:arsenate reductase ArsC [Ectothiorhodospiraceae bacterium WFHF3C12]|nr:arsenate reductase ArsC [Ectothiorhodospiraceae bacterium WFHF3C12]
MRHSMTYNVLFLCTGNSARSIMAEALMNQIGAGRFTAYSAGSDPRGQVHPMAVELLQSMRFDTGELRSKSWSEFAGPNAPGMDFVFTVCDRAATEPCPVWPGQPMTAHWGIEDPAAVEGNESARRKAFRRAFFALQQRIRLFTALPLGSLDRLRLQKALDDIGSTPAEEFQDD